MGNVIYTMSVSLDGFIAGPGGDISWGEPDEEVHRFHNERTRELGAYLLGRRLYETMRYWDAPKEGLADYALEFAPIWKALSKVVFSRTLETVGGDARLASRDVAEEVAALKAESGKDIGVGGARLASSLMRDGLIDEYRLFVHPVVLGAGTRYFGALDARLDLELVETRTFGSRVVYQRYRSAVTP